MGIKTTMGTTGQIITGSCLELLPTLEDESIQCCVTSPPYWQQRDYNSDKQIGLEAMPHDYIEKLVQVFQEVRRVLTHDGTLWLNLGDTYASGGKGGGGSFMDERKNGSWTGKDKTGGWRSPPKSYKQKDLMGLPWQVALALRADGWYLRADIIWHKPNPMPSSVKDRPTTAHEYLFLLSKSEDYYYDAEAIMEPCTSPAEVRNRVAEGYDKGYPGGASFSVGERQWGNGNRRNRRSVWTISPEGFAGAHFATFPTKLVAPCIQAGSRPNDTVLDPFCGAGTTGLVASQLGRNFIGIEVNPEYVKLAGERLRNEGPGPLLTQLEVS